MVLHSVLGGRKTKHTVEFIEEETTWSLPLLFFSEHSDILSTRIAPTKASRCLPPQVLLPWSSRTLTWYFILDYHDLILHVCRSFWLLFIWNSYLKQMWHTFFLSLNWSFKESKYPPLQMEWWWTCSSSLIPGLFHNLFPLSRNLYWKKLLDFETYYKLCFQGSFTYVKEETRYVWSYKRCGRGQDGELWYRNGGTRNHCVFSGPTISYSPFNYRRYLQLGDAWSVPTWLPTFQQCFSKHW